MGIQIGNFKQIIKMAVLKWLNAPKSKRRKKYFIFIFGHNFYW